MRRTEPDDTDYGPRQYPGDDERACQEEHERAEHGPDYDPAVRQLADATQEGGA